VAVGGPDLDNQERRRALGRQMVIRWGLRDPSAKAPSTPLRTGTLYHPHSDLRVFLPEVSNRRLGEACLELLGPGADASRMVLVAADGRLKLGSVRLRLSGELDHPGAQAVGQALRTERLARLVFGIGPLPAGSKALRAERWPEEEWARLEELEEPFARFVDRLRQVDTLSSLAAEVNDPSFWGPLKGQG